MHDTIQCLENVDLIGGNKYICRVHDADIYIDPEFWDSPDDSFDTPICENVSVCTKCGELSNDMTETFFDIDGDPYHKECYCA